MNSGITVGLGWVGVVLIFSAFLLNSHGIVATEGYLYPMMNFAGAALFGYDLFTRKSWSGVTLQSVWCLIAISSLLRLIFL